MASYYEVIVWKGKFHTDKGYMYGVLIKHIFI